jgi:hypothetical protein
VKRVVRRWMLAAMVVLAVSAVYPAFVLGYTWYHVLRSGLPGGENGPLDAYRHALAAAVVAYTLGPAVLEWAIDVTERGYRGSAGMDRHNDGVGGRIGQAAPAFSGIEPAVLAHVMNGAVNTSDPQQITWLPPRRWRGNRLW